MLSCKETVKLWLPEVEGRHQQKVTVNGHKVLQADKKFGEMVMVAFSECV